MAEPPSLKRPISPPPVKKRRKSHAITANQNTNPPPKPLQPSLAAIEAGQTKIRDHLQYFSAHFAKLSKPTNESVQRLSIPDFERLYQRNQHAKGRHFVIHQHNHPVAGVHYDLRLQFSETSTISFAIPYGIPGNANSKRQGRMGIETRVHNLWISIISTLSSYRYLRSCPRMLIDNNLIESASHATGSLLIWDTGEYTVLPRRTPKKQAETDDEVSGSELGGYNFPSGVKSDSEKLFEAFQSVRFRYIRLRFHGKRLPKNYTITLRLPTANDIVKRPAKKRHKKPGFIIKRPDSDSEYDDAPTVSTTADDEAIANASEDEVEDSTIRQSNAYTGATNTIGSVHQRHWFIMLDKVNSGFKKENGEWVRNGSGNGFEAFFVRGAEVERSVITGRLCAEVMADEGVEGFQGRKKWWPVLE
ncbi:hypothetical protein EJ08DRAFT_577514 [Tothia fuscella]|uniref:DNA ligase D 3'-phosphoesterase domain-containing protein n=1 Tax=Tothia fuscella TaxID=1048955 RepID=A0A9P4P4W5_9PEZI|nr:hypothetical protein EJ08DRAFT_577514 [Tothia fuscella]